LSFGDVAATVFAVSTLAEIEEAVDALPPAEQVALLRRIESKVRGTIAAGGRLVMENGRAVLLAPPGAPAMTPDLVKALLADFP
jgi:hypothetical protein